MAHLHKDPCTMACHYSPKEGEKSIIDPYTLEMEVDDLLKRYDSPVLPLPFHSLKRDIMHLLTNRIEAAKVEGYKKGHIDGQLIR